MADPVTPEPVADPAATVDEEFATLGDFVTHVVETTRKAFAKDLAELLDLGADTSANPTKTDPAPNPPKPAAEPIKAGRKWSFL